MCRLLYPRLWVTSIHAIDGRMLWQRGIRGLILDVDNTLVPWGETEMTPATRAWLKSVQLLGFRVCLVSNNRRRRVEAFGAVLGLPVVSGAVKPLRRAFAHAMRLLGTVPSETAVIGDQIFTDILGGNLMGLYTILVNPLSRREFFTTRINRQAEKLLLLYLRRKGAGPCTLDN